MATRKGPKKANRRDLYREITDRMIAALEAGTVPWRRPWTAESGAPRNAATGRHYNGANVLLLAMAAMERGYADPRWLTFKQAKKLGGHVRKGERGTMVIFFRFIEAKDDDGETRRIPLLRCYTVFNVEQCAELELAPLEKPAREHEPHEAADSLVAEYLADGPTLTHGGGVACYSPMHDAIRMPPPETFETSAHYYATLFHEVTHSTGHSSRLDRIESTTFGDHAYSREELVAEMGAAFLCAMAGIDAPELEQNSAAYLSSWIKVLREDPRAIVWAAGRASKAVDLVTGAREEVAEAA